MITKAFVIDAVRTGLFATRAAHPARTVARGHPLVTRCMGGGQGTATRLERT